MQSIQTIVTRLVKNYLNNSGITQKTLAAALGITQPTLSRKLTGIRTWSLDELDQLVQIGVPVSFDIFGAAINEEYAQKESK